ncbi:MAG TPA: hypothetical protein VHN14_22555 [Kofleriaceae bacterium]|jgi:hypothetical protein|nr:hypothetical protein [Kofleriaceae bacterium]
MRAWIAVFLGAAAATATAHADTNRDELWIGGAARALRSSSANALTGDNLAGTSLGYARDLGLPVVPGLALWADAGMTTGSADGTMFQSLSTEITTIGLTGGLRARYQLHRLIAASAQVSLGAQRARVAITDHAGTSASDHGWGAMAEACAALDLFAVAHPPFGIGVRAEFGYVVARAISLTARRPASGDVLMLPMEEVGLGGLDLSGPAFALSLVGQF